MAAAAQIVEGMGADVVDVNMGCPVPKIAKHNAGCSLMREPEHAQPIVSRDGARGEDSGDGEDARRLGRHATINAPELARRMEDAGAAAVAVHGRTAAQSYSGCSDWDLIAQRRVGVAIPVFGSGDCVEPAAARRAPRAERRRRRARRPRRAAQPVDLRAGARLIAGGGRPREVTARGSRPVPARLHRPAAATNVSTKRTASATSRRPGRCERRSRRAAASAGSSTSCAR